MSGLLTELRDTMHGAAFGLVDGVITVLGLTLGISALNPDRIVILVAGLSVGIADGIANSVGFFVSEEVETEQRISSHTKKAIYYSSAPCFGATLIAVLLPMIPYIFTSITMARISSIVIGLSLLFVFGMIHARFSHESPVKEGLKLVAIGAITVAICFGVGKLVSMI